jgi:hypothetical protein
MVRGVDLSGLLVEFSQVLILGEKLSEEADGYLQS